MIRIHRDSNLYRYSFDLFGKDNDTLLYKKNQYLHQPPEYLLYKVKYVFQVIRKRETYYCEGQIFVYPRINILPKKSFNEAEPVLNKSNLLTDKQLELKGDGTKHQLIYAVSYQCVAKSHKYIPGSVNQHNIHAVHLLVSACPSYPPETISRSTSESSSTVSGLIFAGSTR